ncbi:PTS ascorbate transporter subunit IIC [Entomospira culicis]|uniref:Ascorbate-specific PTS system EIIC component n=1 Tax=Entomospira culicis TaxID=2719989 RepID=A0A968KUD1_9SPIO|nr:PTS ascorbate transporter subunit IIC [Entomospira culicis]NIZ19225.1 PTS ascorbate transporter subunit IIC [Entomospira culicis]NIZ69439.1 PTS ascorbate transporter subunit IIC [Entomospira culicis]WDI36555.1 PTS ascorbate transporter subunit IIC [Entomospira culicis]WDI38181.1 PTS ascorbate transporter subunit IIC [Entomospira culicis]
MRILFLLQSILSEPALILGLVAMIGLIAGRKSWDKVLVGSMGPILGYLMLGAGATVIVENMEALGLMIEKGFHIKGVVPNNEAIVATAQSVLGMETMAILVAGLVFNLLIARFTRYKYIFLTGHHSFFMAALLSAVLATIGLSGFQLILIGGFFLGAWSAISPAIGQKYTELATDGDGIAMGHFGSLGYYLSAFIGEKIGDKSQSTENLKISEKLGFLRNSTLSTAITMVVFYSIAAMVAGYDFVLSLSGGQHPVIFVFLSALKFAVGVAIVYNGVRMIVADLLPAFQGISQKLIPNSVAAVDCAVFFPYAPTAVIIGFAFSFLGGVIGMFILGAMGWVLIIPGLVPHFFCGATAGIYGNATGGKRGAMIGAFVNGLLLAFLPAMLLPVLGALGFANTTFGDVDFAVIGILLGQVGQLLGTVGIYGLVGIVLLILITPNFMRRK